MRDSPEFGRGTAAGQTGDVDREVRQRAPEVVERDAVGGVGAKALVVRINVAIDGDVGRRGAQACHLGVVAHLEVEWAGSAPVSAGHEQQSVPLRSELVGDLLVGDGVDGCLDLTRRHARVKDRHIRSEVRRRRANQTERPNREQTTKGKAAWQVHNMGDWGMLWEDRFWPQYLQAMKAVQERRIVAHRVFGRSILQPAHRIW